MRCVIILQWTITGMSELGVGTHEGDFTEYDLEYLTSGLRKGKYCMILFFKFQMHAKVNNILCWVTYEVNI